MEDWLSSSSDIKLHKIDSIPSPHLFCTEAETFSIIFRSRVAMLTSFGLYQEMIISPSVVYILPQYSSNQSK